MTVAVRPPPNGKVRLVNGQHRVAALIQLVEENTAKSKTTAEDSVCIYYLRNYTTV